MCNGWMFLKGEGESKCSVTVAGSTCKGGIRLCGLTLLYSGIDPLL